jgi:glycosyltransferase involved in cell wall biosynthesis
MRVMVHCTEYGGPWNEGTRIIARAVAERMRRRGHEVLIGARTVTADSEGAMAIGQDRLATFALAGTVARAHRVDVIHTIQSLSTLTGFRCAALKRTSGARVLLHVTGLGPTTTAHGLLGKADRVVVGGPYLKRFFPAADVVYPMPGVADVTPLDPPPPTKEPAVAFLGAFEQHRGVETLLEACALLRSRGVRFRLKLAWNGVGGPEGRARVLRAAQASDINVDIEGTVDLRTFYRDAHVVVIPRVSMQRMTLPLRIVECALLQRPIVVARILGMDAIVRDMGGSFVPGSAASLADALTPLLTDPVHWRSCRSAAAERREEFLPEVGLERLERVYARLGS